jgi:hypothetical protein
MLRRSWRRIILKVLWWQMIIGLWRIRSIGVHPNVIRTLIIIEAIPGGMITSSTNVTFCMLRRRISTKWGNVALRVA